VLCKETNGRDHLFFKKCNQLSAINNIPKNAPTYLIEFAQWRAFNFALHQIKDYDRAKHKATVDKFANTIFENEYVRWWSLNKKQAVKSIQGEGNLRRLIPTEVGE